MAPVLKRPLPILLAPLLLAVNGHAVPLLEVMAKGTLKIEIRGDGRNQLTIVAKNPGTDGVSIEVSAGMVADGKSGSRVAVIRRAEMQIASGQTGEMVVPVVPLSLKNGAAVEVFAPVTERIEALQPFLDLSAKENDLPRATAQLAALLLLDQIDLMHWQEFLRKEESKDPRPTPADIAAAVDAIAIVRKLAPERKIAMADDPEFRLRALRNPWSRAKAMQLFGMNPPEGVPIPDVNQLLHTRPGDNCPICRLRNQSDPSNGL